MSRVASLIYGGVLVFLGFAALVEILPSNLLRAVLVFTVGVVIMWTDHGTSHGGAGLPVLQRSGSDSFFMNARRWFFGGFVTLVGVISFLLDFNKLPDFLEILSPISLETLAGPWLIIAIGAIYLVSSSKKHREMVIKPF